MLMSVLYTKQNLHEVKLIQYWQDVKGVCLAHIDPTSLQEVQCLAYIEFNFLPALLENKMFTGLIITDRFLTTYSTRRAYTTL